LERIIKLLELSHLNVSYGDMVAVREVTLRVGEAEIVSVLGSNGAGKSTTLKAISGLIPVISGEIYFHGQRIDNIPSHKIVRIGIVQVPEGRRIFPFLSVFENLILASHTKEAKKIRKNNLEVVFDLMPALKERKNQMGGLLSGGEQQMLAIGRGLMANPKLLMLDEPSLGLAPFLIRSVFQTVHQINKQGIAILLVEQNVSHSLSISNRGYVFENGSISIEGAKDELLENEYLKKAYLGI